MGNTMLTTGKDQSVVDSVNPLFKAVRASGLVQTASKLFQELMKGLTHKREKHRWYIPVAAVPDTKKVLERLAKHSPNWTPKRYMPHPNGSGLFVHYDNEEKWNSLIANGTHPDQAKHPGKFVVLEVGRNVSRTKHTLYGTERTYTTEVIRVIEINDWVKESEGKTLCFSVDNYPKADYDLINNPILDVVVKTSKEPAKSELNPNGGWVDAARKGDANDTEEKLSNLFEYLKDGSLHVLNRTWEEMATKVRFYTRNGPIGLVKAIKRLTIVDMDDAFCMHTIKKVIVLKDSVDSLVCYANPVDIIEVVRYAYKAGKLTHETLHEFERDFREGKLDNQQYSFRGISLGRLAKGNLETSSNVPAGELWYVGNSNWVKEIEVLDHSITKFSVRIGKKRKVAALSRSAVCFIKGILAVMEAGFKQAKTKIEKALTTEAFIDMAAQMGENEAKLAKLIKDRKDGDNNRFYQLAAVLLRSRYLDTMRKMVAKSLDTGKFIVEGTVSASFSVFTSATSTGKHDRKVLEQWLNEESGRAVLIGGLMILVIGFLKKLWYALGGFDFDDTVNFVANRYVGEYEGYRVFRGVMWRWPLGWREVSEVTVLVTDKRTIEVFPMVGLFANPWQVGEQIAFGQTVAEGEDLFKPFGEMADLYQEELTMDQIRTFKAPQDLIGKFYNALVKVIGAYARNGLMSEMDHNILKISTSLVTDLSKGDANRDHIKGVNRVCGNISREHMEVPGFLAKHVGYWRNKKGEYLLRNKNSTNSVTIVTDDEFTSTWNRIETEWQEFEAAKQKNLLLQIEEIRKILPKWDGRSIAGMGYVDFLASKWGSLWRTVRSLEEDQVGELESLEVDSEEREAKSEEHNSTMANARSMAFGEMNKSYTQIVSQGDAFAESIGAGLLIRWLALYGTETTTQEGETYTNTGMNTYLFTQDGYDLCTRGIALLLSDREIQTHISMSASTANIENMHRISQALNEDLAKGLTPIIDFHPYDHLQDGVVSTEMKVGIVITGGLA